MSSPIDARTSMPTTVSAPSVNLKEVSSAKQHERVGTTSKNIGIVLGIIGLVVHPLLIPAGISLLHWRYKVGQANRSRRNALASL